MIRACAIADLPEGEVVRIVAHVPISVFHTEGGFFAVDDTCTHQDASLADGWLDGCFVECPLHSAMFDLRTGRPTCLPAKDRVRTYPVVITDGVFYVDAGDRDDAGSALCSPSVDVTA
jgi:3-phenylpropionate/trans-cinnamate dioxygenase ferredoxin subunit